MNLSLQTERLSVCQLPPDAAVPSWALAADGFSAITRTADELSLVCRESAVPKGVKQERGWRAFKVAGPLDFALTGILASIANPLTQAGISLFALSTYNTDYVLVKEEQVPAAVAALQSARHTVTTG